MKFELIEGVSTLSFDLIGTLALAILLLMMGYAIRQRVSFLNKFCIPAPVIGGLIFSILALVLRQSDLIQFKMDTVLQSPLMIAFFTTVGLGGSLALLKKGGIVLIVYWLSAGVLSISQNVIGVAVAKLTGIHPLLGIMSGAVSMAGGHGGAAAFGETAESVMGVTGSMTVGMAAATFGLISGSLLGGPVARFLILKHDLKPTFAKYGTVDDALGAKEGTEINYHSVMYHLAILSVVMVIGSVASRWLSSMMNDLILPGYVGAMFVAVILRNLNDKFKLFKFNFKIIDLFGDVSLGIFLSMALMSLKLWELMDLAVPMFIILTAQVVFIVLYAVFIVFRLVGKDFDAAIMVSGMLGHGLGATPNAIANMGSVTEKYGPSSKAFLIVPLVGAFLVDIIHIPNIVWFMNFFK